MLIDVPLKFDFHFTKIQFSGRHTVHINKTISINIAQFVQRIDFLLCHWRTLRICSSTMFTNHGYEVTITRIGIWVINGEARNGGISGYGV